MERQVIVDPAIRAMRRSRALVRRLGFTFDPAFPDEQGARRVFGGHMTRHA